MPQKASQGRKQPDGMEIETLSLFSPGKLSLHLIPRLSPTSIAVSRKRKALSMPAEKRRTQVLRFRLRLLII